MTNSNTILLSAILALVSITLLLTIQDTVFDTESTVKEQTDSESTGDTPTEAPSVEQQTAKFYTESGLDVKLEEKIACLKEAATCLTYRVVGVDVEDQLYSDPQGTMGRIALSELKKEAGLLWSDANKVMGKVDGKELTSNQIEYLKRIDTQFEAITIGISSISEHYGNAMQIQQAQFSDDIDLARALLQSTFDTNIAPSLQKRNLVSFD
ncbi:hypothetical protein HY484_04765 [Candidatus Woesearchaeota archaeon]|nr:hypothetical protein [Candidatus Woesearchaeota archaeon]